MEIVGYKIVEQIGSGGMADVYLAIQLNLDRKVALKVMRGSLASSDSFSHRFMREAKIVAQLSHPNIIPIYDIGIVNDNYFIAMEYQPGGELNKLIKESLSLSNTIKIVKQIANALHFSHQNNIIHRDLKPSNILLDGHYNALISDFGLARSLNVSSRITASISTFGTPYYMSPEQVQGKEVDHRADIYSLGIILYEMLNGEPPFTGETAIAVAVKHMTEPMPRLKQEFIHFQPLLDKLLHKDPNQRLQSANDIIESLHQIESTDSNTDLSPKEVLASPVNTSGIPKWGRLSIAGLLGISGFLVVKTAINFVGY